MSQLEELNIDVNPDNEQWDAHVEDIVTEVCTLKKLETLKFYFPRVELLSTFSGIAYHCLISDLLLAAMLSALCLESHLMLNLS